MTYGMHIEICEYQILELGTLAKLMEMAHSEFTEEATKALYAISALIRNNLEGQRLFYNEAGDLMLQVKTLNRLYNTFEQ